MKPPGPSRQTLPPARWLTGAWIALAVTAGHGLVFWWVADKHFLLKTPRIPPPNFAAREARSVDPQTGETVVQREFAVSTRFAPSPPPAASPAK